MTVKIVVGAPSSPEAQRADFVICAFAVPRENLPEQFKDNVEGFCEDCRAPIMWRPESPNAKKICNKCAASKLAKLGAKGIARQFDDEIEEEELIQQLFLLNKVVAESGVTHAPVEAARASLEARVGDNEQFREGVFFAFSILYSALMAEKGEGTLVGADDEVMKRVDGAIAAADREVMKAILFARAMTSESGQ